jgi:hypothetical protein
MRYGRVPNDGAGVMHRRFVQQPYGRIRTG